MTAPGDPRAAGPSARRIKRRVAAPTHEFFAATAPGLEPLCRQELAAPPLSAIDAAVVAGGVTFSGRLVELYRANLHLRTANRILMRIAAFSAENFRELRRQMAKVDWDLFLPRQAKVQVRVHTRHCRLYHSDAVARRVEAHLQQVLGAPPAESAPVASVFVRGTNDRFVVSVDSSGELLHRRGVKTHPAAAPLRETLAAAILMWAGCDTAEPLLDPMCGSGTFALEAASMGLRIPPGWHRRFAFEQWPAFRRRQWQHLRKEAEQGFADPVTVRIFAGDRDPAALFSLRGCLLSWGLSRSTALFAGDFFDLRPQRMAAGPGLVVLNPPYGRRLKAADAGRADADALFSHLARVYCGWKASVVLPTEQIGRIPFPHEKRRLVHGGLKLALITGRIPTGR